MPRALAALDGSHSRQQQQQEEQQQQQQEWVFKAVKHSLSGCL